MQAYCMTRTGGCIGSVVIRAHVGELSSGQAPLWRRSGCGEQRGLLDRQGRRRVNEWCLGDVFFDFGVSLAAAD